MKIIPNSASVAYTGYAKNALLFDANVSVMYLPIVCQFGLCPQTARIYYDCIR